MRVWVVAPALLALAGCATGSFTYVESAPPRPVPEPETLAKRLMAMQPDWPKPRRLDCAETGCVALTFDDGPGRHTGRLLNILRARDVKATFFVVGEMVAAGQGAQRVRQMVADGHELGNHSWSHRQLTALPKSRIRRQLRRTDRLVRSLTGRPDAAHAPAVRVHRPPRRRADAPPGAGADPVERRHLRLA